MKCCSPCAAAPLPSIRPARLLSPGSKRWYCLWKKCSCAGEMNGKIIQNAHTHQWWRSWLAGHFKVFCCYRFPPVRAAAASQTWKFMVQLAVDRNTLLWGALLSHTSPQCCLWASRLRSNLWLSESLQVGEVINTLCGYQTLKEEVRGTAGYFRRISVFNCFTLELQQFIACLKKELAV